MKKNSRNFTNPDDLNKNLQYSSPSTWITLSVVILLLIGFFTWSCIYKIKIKITGIASIVSGTATLNVNESKLNQLKKGQKVYISNQVGEILSFDNKQPVVSTFTLDDGKYAYYIIIGEMRPVDFLLK